MNPNGEPHCIKQKVKKISNDLKINGDLFNPDDVRKYLKSLNLEKETEYGEPYVYKMFIKGRSTGMPFKLSKDGKPAPFVRLFPGYNSKGKGLELYPNGMID